MITITINEKNSMDAMIQDNQMIRNAVSAADWAYSIGKTFSKSKVIFTPHTYVPNAAKEEYMRSV